MDQVADAAEVVDEQQRGDPREVGTESQPRATHDLFTDPAAADVEIDSDARVLRYFPDRVPVSVPEVRLVEGFR